MIAIQSRCFIFLPQNTCKIILKWECNKVFSSVRLMSSRAACHKSLLGPSCMHCCVCISFCPEQCCDSFNMNLEKNNHSIHRKWCLGYQLFCNRSWIASGLKVFGFASSNSSVWHMCTHTQYALQLETKLFYLALLFYMEKRKSQLMYHYCCY